jgi:hypothetical protein
MNRQGIHIGPQGDHRTRVGPGDLRHDSRSPDPFPARYIELFQAGYQALGRVLLPVAEFWVAVQVPAKGYHPVINIPGEI